MFFFGVRNFRKFTVPLTHNTCIAGLVNEVTKAADILVEHFAGSNDFFDKVSKID